MATFRYRAREASGARAHGVIEALDRREALERLERQGLYPASLEDCGDRGGASARGGRGPGHEGRSSPEIVPPGPESPASAARSPARRALGRISRRDITSFTRGLATLLEATIPIPAALSGLALEEENPALRRLIEELASSVRQGNAFSEALAAHPREFTPLHVSMAQVGEETGHLDRVLADLADLMEREDEMRGEIAGAVAYPCFVLALGAATTFILLAFVMPRLFGILEETAEVLPLPTRVLLGASELFARYWLALLVALGGGLLALRLWLLTPGGRLLWDRWKLRLPVVGSVFRAAALGRFARTLGTLAHSGVSLLPALKIVENTVGNRWLGRSIERVAEETRGGDSLAAPLRKLGVFPPTVVQMVAVGEETGRLDSMLLRVAQIEEREMRSRSRTLISLLAPALILLLGLIVGFLVMALLLPIFQMSQSIR